MSDSEVDLAMEGDPIEPTQENKKKKKKKKKKKSGKKPQIDATTDTTTDASGDNKIRGEDLATALAKLALEAAGPKRTNPLYGMKANLPIGKNTTQLPEGYSNNASMNVSEAPAAGFLFPENVSRIFTTIPVHFENATLKDNPDGWCEVILDKPYLKLVIYTACRNFPLPIPRPLKPLQCVRPSSISGMGMFATADLELNDLILAERPLLITPSAFLCRAEIAEDKSLTYEQKVLICLQDQEKSLQYSIDRMLPEARAAYMSLANCHLEDGSGPLVGISRTNSFGTSFEEGGDRHSAVYDKLSRINHSCLPNAAVKFNTKTFAGELHAIRPIKAGEEIYISYCAIEDPRAERQKDLKKYGFNCFCELCSSPDLEEFRRRMVFSVRKLAPFLDHKKIDRISKEELESTAKESAQWARQIEERNFHGADAYCKHLEVVVSCYSKLGDIDESIRWTTPWYLTEQALAGADGETSFMYTLAVMAPLTMRAIQSRLGM